MEHSKRKKTHGFRQLPVKGTGQRNRSWRYWRQPKTTHEKRACFVEPDLEGKQTFFREKRNLRALSYAWDDFERASFRVRSWKDHRKTQWK